MNANDPHLVRHLVYFFRKISNSLRPTFFHHYFLASGLNMASSFLCILIIMIPFVRSNFFLPTVPSFGAACLYRITALPPLLATLLSALPE
jgi:hypothetical protein